MKPMTESAMLAEIEKALRPSKGEDGFTLVELAEKLGYNPNNYAVKQVGQAVSALIAKGKASKVRIIRQNVWGVSKPMWGVKFGKAP